MTVPTAYHEPTPRPVIKTPLPPLIFGLPGSSQSRRLLRPLRWQRTFVPVLRRPGIQVVYYDAVKQRGFANLFVSQTWAHETTVMSFEVLAAVQPRISVHLGCDTESLVNCLATFRHMAVSSSSRVKMYKNLRRYFQHLRRCH